MMQCEIAQQADACAACTCIIRCAAHLVHPVHPDGASLLMALRLGQEGHQVALEHLLLAPLHMFVVLAGLHKGVVILAHLLARLGALLLAIRHEPVRLITASLAQIRNWGIVGGLVVNLQHRMCVCSCSVSMQADDWVQVIRAESWAVQAPFDRQIWRILCIPG